MPAKPNHLIQRGTTYHVRLDIPQDLRPAFGNRKILSKSLKTGDKTLARELAATQIGHWKSQFRAIRDEKLKRGDLWREEAFEASKAMAEHVQTRTLQLAGISQHPEPTPEQLAEAEAEAERVHKELAGQGFTPSGPAFRFDIRDKPLTEQVGQLKAFAEWASQASARRLAQQYNVTDSKELQAILADHRTYKPKSPISKSLQERFAAHLATQSDNERTRSVALSKIKAFSDWLTAEGKPLDFDSVAEYLDVVGSNAQTRKGHLWALRKIWRWAIKYDAPFRDQFRSAADPFTGHEHARVGATAGGSWAAYTREEAEQLHRAAANKDKDLADLIAFACYTGCRIEELGRISTNSTMFENGVPVGFMVDDAKTAAGIRTLPIADRLLPLYRARLELAEKNNGYLFQGNDKTKSGIRLNALSQRFTKLKRAQGFSDRYVFHSFRKCTATQLQQAGVSPLIIPALLGHEVGHISFDVYSSGASMTQKTEAINTLSFAFP